MLISLPWKLLVSHIITLITNHTNHNTNHEIEIRLLVPVSVIPVRQRVEQKGEKDEDQVPDQECGDKLSVHQLQLQIAAKQNVQT